jgi:hypothetical protein
MKVYSWKNTQFSQFNESDTLLLVSGVHFGNHSNTGEIAVFNLEVFFEVILKNKLCMIIKYLAFTGELRDSVQNVK